MLRVTIYEYLKRIEVEEKQIRTQRRHIPDIKDMATAANISTSNYYKWAGNRTKNIGRLITFKAIIYLRSLGFDTQLTDILKCVPDEEV